jgi:hypothetical protein
MGQGPKKKAGLAAYGRAGRPCYREFTLQGLSVMQDRRAMFDLSLSRADHVRRYSIVAVDPAGWEVRCQEDQTLCRLDYYEDWHRVERALKSFQLEVHRLSESGWHVASS